MNLWDSRTFRADTHPVYFFKGVFSEILISVGEVERGRRWIFVLCRTRSMEEFDVTVVHLNGCRRTEYISSKVTHMAKLLKSTTGESNIIGALPGRLGKLFLFESTSISLKLQYFISKLVFLDTSYNRE